jgi:hypothetical protein
MAMDWQVVTNPPGEFRSSMVFATEAAATEFLAKAPPHSYVLPPASNVTELSVRFPASWSRAKRSRAMATVALLENGWQRFKAYNPGHARRCFVYAKGRQGRIIATLYYGDTNTGGRTPCGMAFEPEESEITSVLPVDPV